MAAEASHDTNARISASARVGLRLNCSFRAISKIKFTMAGAVDVIGSLAANIGTMRGAMDSGRIIGALATVHGVSADDSPGFIKRRNSLFVKRTAGVLFNGTHRMNFCHGRRNGIILKHTSIVAANDRFKAVFDCARACVGRALVPGLGTLGHDVVHSISRTRCGHLDSRPGAARSPVCVSGLDRDSPHFNSSGGSGRV